MKKLHLVLIIHSIIIAALVFSVMLAIVSFLPYETLAHALNSLASDGSLASFTLKRYQNLSAFLKLIGCVITLIAGVLLIYWPSVQGKIIGFLIQAGDFKKLLWRDAQAFCQSLLAAFKPRNERLLITGLIFIAFSIRLANLFIPMEFDEAYTYNAFASHSILHTISNYHVPNNHVLLTVFINILVHSFGNHLWLIRLPSLIAGILMIPAGYFLAKKIYGEETGILSAVFIGLFPELVKYSVLARGYILISLFTLLILILGCQVKENKNRFAWLLLIIFSALGFFTVPIMLLPFGVVYVWLFLSAVFGNVSVYHSKIGFIKYWLASGFLTALLAALLYTPIMLNNHHWLFGNKFVAPLDQNTYLSTAWLGLQATWNVWTLAIPNWVVFICAACFFLGIIFHASISRQEVPMQYACIIWIFFFSIIRRPDMESRMWVFLLAPLLIWSSAGFIGALKIISKYTNRKRDISRVFSSLVLVFALLSALSTYLTISQRWQQKGSVENSVLYLKDHLRKGDLISTSMDFKPLLQYYFEVYDIPITYLRKSTEYERVFMLVRSVNGSAAVGDTVGAVVPKNDDGTSAIDLTKAEILLQFKDLTLYEGYPYP